MKFRTCLAAMVALGFTLTAGHSPAGAVAVTELLPPGTGDVCQPFQDDRRLVCLSIDKGDIENFVAPSVTACVYDEALNRVMWWYGGSELGCAETYHWAWLGTPGACVGTGATGRPTACVGKDVPAGGAGAYGERTPTEHCLVWVMGNAFCFLD